MTSPVQTILMCPPDHFEVTYVINPWMEGQVAKTDKILARRQWDGLRNALARHAEVVLQSPQPGLPDLVFTANAGLVAGTKVIVSRFRAAQRQGEEPHYRAWFEANGFELLDWPTEFPFEGAGDALFDRGEDLLWVGHGFRSHPASSALLERMLGCRTAPLDLVDPRFYHLDTCLCPLASGHLLYYPPAFADLSRALIESLVPASRRIAVDEADALQFCCNAIELAGRVFMNNASQELQKRLRRAGFIPVIAPMSEFLKSGGAAKCLTLNLVERRLAA